MRWHVGLDSEPPDYVIFDYIGLISFNVSPSGAHVNSFSLETLELWLFFVFSRGLVLCAFFEGTAF